MPRTWVELSVRYGLGLDPYDPHDNILAGAAYLKEMHDRFGSAGFLAAYHAGPLRYEQHLETGRPLPPETVAYVSVLTPLLASEQNEREAPHSARHSLPGSSTLYEREDGAFAGDQVAHDTHPMHRPSDRPTVCSSTPTPLPAGLFAGRSAMSGIASCRKALRVLGSLKFGQWLLGTGDRRGQDKNRKVRTVGLVGNSAECSTRGAHCERLAQLAFFDNTLTAFDFYHLASQL